MNSKNNTADKTASTINLHPGDDKLSFEERLLLPKDKFLLKFRINSKKINELRKLGVYLYERSKEAEQKIIQKHAALADKLEIDAYDLNRKDAVGTKRSDSGEEIIHEKNVRAKDLFQSLLALNMNVNVSIYRKEGEHMGFLTLSFQNTKVTNPVNAAAKKYIGEKFISAAFEFLYGYNNVDRTMTFNFSHVIPTAAGQKGYTLTLDPQTRIPQIKVLEHN